MDGQISQLDLEQGVSGSFALEWDQQCYSPTCMGVDEHDPSHLLVGTEEGSTGIVDLNSQECIDLFNTHSQKVTAVDLVGKELYSAGHDGYFKVRDLEYGIVVHSFISCTCPLSCMAVESPGVVYIGSWDGQIKKLDLRMKSCANVMLAKEHAESPVRCLELASLSSLHHTDSGGGGGKPGRRSSSEKSGKASANILFAAHGIGEIMSWDSRMNKQLVENYQGHTDVVNAMAIHNGRLFSGGDDRTVRVFDVQKGTELETLYGHTNSVTCFDVVDDVLVTGSFDRSTRQYKLPTIEATIAIKLMKQEVQEKERYEHWLASKSKFKKKKKKKTTKTKGKTKKKSKKGKSSRNLKKRR